jgi:hypothetical protein
MKIPQVWPLTKLIAISYVPPNLRVKGISRYFSEELERRKDATMSQQRKEAS